MASKCRNKPDLADAKDRKNAKNIALLIRKSVKISNRSKTKASQDKLGNKDKCSQINPGNNLANPISQNKVAQIIVLVLAVQVQEPVRV